MKGYFVTITTICAVLLGVRGASAQELAAGAHRWEVTGFPGGGIFFTEGSRRTGEPDFGNYGLGGSLTYNFNHYWGVEGELGGAFGVDQDLDLRGGVLRDVSPPNLLAYHVNAIVYPFRNDRRLVPYATGGVGGLTMFEKRSVGFDDDETFFTGNVGGGVKWYFGRWGVRADYRFFAVNSKEEAPVFFGRDTRYGHRVYGGLLFGFGH